MEKRVKLFILFARNSSIHIIDLSATPPQLFARESVNKNFYLGLRSVKSFVGHEVSMGLSYVHMCYPIRTLNDP